VGIGRCQHFATPFFVLSIALAWNFSMYRQLLAAATLARQAILKSTAEMRCILLAVIL
jgi:hypothetical protein